MWIDHTIFVWYKSYFLTQQTLCDLIHKFHIALLVEMLNHIGMMLSTYVSQSRLIGILLLKPQSFIKSVLMYLNCILWYLIYKCELNGISLHKGLQIERPLTPKHLRSRTPVYERRSPLLFFCHLRLFDSNPKTALCTNSGYYKCLVPSHNTTTHFHMLSYHM